MQIHGPTEVLHGITVKKLNHGDGKPSVVVEFGGTDLILQTIADADEVIKAVVAAKDLLLGATSEPAGVPASECQHLGGDGGPLASMTGSEVAERYLADRGRQRLESLLLLISGYCPGAFMEAVNAQDGRTAGDDADRAIASFQDVGRAIAADLDEQAGAEPDEPCGPGCGYVSHGQDLIDHMRYEHTRCADCGREPRDGDSVTHKLDCPRLQPGYTYPAGDVPGWDEPLPGQDGAR